MISALWDFYILGFLDNWISAFSYFWIFGRWDVLIRGFRIQVFMDFWISAFGVWNFRFFVFGVSGSWDFCIVGVLDFRISECPEFVDFVVFGFRFLEFGIHRFLHLVFLDV